MALPEFAEKWGDAEAVTTTDGAADTALLLQDGEIVQILLNNLLAGKIVAGTPASAAATGVAGQIKYDASFIYICVSTDVWKRVAIATW